jgi:hypothetical protein
LIYADLRREGLISCLCRGGGLADYIIEIF